MSSTTKTKSDEPRDLDDVTDDLAAGRDVTHAESRDLLEDFLSNKPSRPTSFSVKYGTGDDEREYTFKVRKGKYSQWVTAREKATSDDGQFNGFVAASWMVAQVLVSPKLGPVILRQQKEAEDSADGLIDGPDGDRIAAPTNAAVLLRRMFAESAGSLIELSDAILERGRLGPGSDAVREIEAGKA